jgi:hypothetical protein
MRKTLHILTQASEPLALEVISAQQDQPDCEVETVDLAARNPDYDSLLEKIFAADSVAVW